MNFTLENLVELKYSLLDFNKFLEWYKKNFDDTTIVDHSEVIAKLIDQKSSTDWLENIYVTFKLSGQFKRFYSNGQLFVEGQYKDGQESGKWFWFFESGQIEIEGQFTDGKRSDNWTYFYSNGQIKAQAEYKDGQIESEKIYINGEAETTIYINGELVSKAYKEEVL